jgi:hypothetical protein
MADSGFSWSDLGDSLGDFGQKALDSASDYVGQVLKNKAAPKPAPASPAQQPPSNVGGNGVGGSMSITPVNAGYFAGKPAWVLPVLIGSGGLLTVAVLMLAVSAVRR